VKRTGWSLLGIFFLLLVICTGGFASEDKADQADTVGSATPAVEEKVEKERDEVVVLETGEGVLVLDLFEDLTPNHAERFKELAGSGFYDNTAFHRIIKGFMIQGGNAETKEGEKVKTPPPLNAEFNSKLHVRGSLSGARLGHDINSFSTQFFICLGRAPHLDRQYTNFGQLIAGDEVLGKLGDSPVKASSSTGERSTPVERVSLNKAYVVSREEGLEIAKEKNKSIE